MNRCVLNLKNIALMACFLLALPWSAAFAVEVKFFRQYNAKGELIRYERNGEFSHVAISYNGAWLHAHPYGGVRVLKSLDFLGMDYVILENPNHPEPNLEFISQQLSKTFDIFARWRDPHKTYCSKLIADFFKIKPRRMNFQSQSWNQIKTPKGQLGISPDEIFTELQLNFGFKKKIDFLREAFAKAQTERTLAPRCVLHLR